MCTPAQKPPAAGGAAAAGSVGSDPPAHGTTPELQVDAAPAAVPQQPDPAAERAAPAPGDVGARPSSPDSSAEMLPRKRRRVRENDPDYLASSEEDMLAARAAAAPVQSPAAKKHCGGTVVVRPPARATNRTAGPSRGLVGGLGRGKSQAAKVKVKEDLSVQAVLGRSLDPVPLFDDSRQVCAQPPSHRRRPPVGVAVSRRAAVGDCVAPGYDMRVHLSACVLADAWGMSTWAGWWAWACVDKARTRASRRRPRWFLR